MKRVALILTEENYIFNYKRFEFLVGGRSEVTDYEKIFVLIHPVRFRVKCSDVPFLREKLEVDFRRIESFVEFKRQTNQRIFHFFGEKNA